MTIRYIILLVVVCISHTVQSQETAIKSPDKKINVELHSDRTDQGAKWFLKISYDNNGKVSVAIPRIDLGLSRSDQDFSDDLNLVKISKPRSVKEEYNAVHGKRSHRINFANEIVASLEKKNHAKLNVIIRAYDDGVVFRYEFPEAQGEFKVKDELTSYTIPQGTTRWLERWNTANEGFYDETKGDKVEQRDWCYPALFQSQDSTCFYLLHEADLNRSYCGSKLSNSASVNQYKVKFPDQWDGRGKGEVLPTIRGPWKSPWRVIILGSLSTIVESTLVEDVSAPSLMSDVDWIKPGLVSWNYWSSNHGTKDYAIVCKFADLAARMGWPYTLLDWEWDVMGNGGSLEDAAKYIHSKGVKPLLWYNSGGDHTWVSATPKDRMLTRENRMEEFAKLSKMGFAGVKVDFFESEKQDMIAYYLDILEDAAKFKMLVYFHGCIVPRGWSRTYPHLMTHEAVMGAEWYNNVDFFTMRAPQHNAILPFTRNVVGPMDYTPVTFTNSQNPHITSYAHELGLSVLFESGLQHMADRPEGYDALPDAAKEFLRTMPAAWDETKLLAGYPGRDIVIARRKGAVWYIAGINGENKEKNQSLRFDFLSNGLKYKLTLITDGTHDKDLATQYLSVDRENSIDVKLLRRGGFVALATPLR